MGFLTMRNGENKEYPKSNLFWNVSVFPFFLPQISKCWKYVLPGSGPAVLRSEFRNPGYQGCKAQQTALRNLAMWLFAFLLAEEKHFFISKDTCRLGALVKVRGGPED